MDSIFYTLYPSDGLGIFAIDELSGIIYITTDDQSVLDYEETTLYELQVTCMCVLFIVVVQ